MGNPIDSLSYAVASVRNPQIVTDGVVRALRGLRDGTLSFADFKLIMALEGRIQQVNIGTLATPIAGHTQANFNQLQPDFNLDVPNGTSVIMLPPNIHLETSAGTLNRVIFASLNQLMGAGTSNAVTIGPTSCRSDRQIASTCKALQAYTANGTALGNISTQVEHWRSGYAFADATGAPIKRFQPQIDEWPWPIIVGPGSFQVYYVGTTTAPSGWGQVSWIEFGSERI